MTGNGGDFDNANPASFTPGKLGSSFVKLSTQGGKLTQVDYFTPFNQECLDTCDLDLGTAGPMLLPGLTQLVGGGKEGRFYRLDMNNMGKFHANSDQILQSFKATEDQYVQAPTRNKRCDPPFVGGASTWNAEANSYPHIHGSPVVWTLVPGNTYMVYLWGERDRLKAFGYENGAFRDPTQQPLNCNHPGNATPVDQSNEIAAKDTMPGGILSLSADGSRAGTGIVWASYPLDDGNSENARAAIPTGVLSAYDASNLKSVLWTSQSAVQDRLGPQSFAKFCPPTVANGKVYMATFSGKVVVYGLRPGG
jgi:hypothetical protein